MGENFEAAARLTLGVPKFDRFREPNRPGRERGESQPHHDDFHGDNGAEKHAPRGKIARQGRRQQGIGDARPPGNTSARHRA